MIVGAEIKRESLPLFILRSRRLGQFVYSERHAK